MVRTEFRRAIGCAVAAVAMSTLPGLAIAQELPALDPKDLVPLAHGPNLVDLDGDGRQDLVVKSRWEINGPHSASVYSFHRRLGPEDPFRYEGPDWHLVPFIEDKPDRPHGVETIVTHEGADCILRDLRLFTHGKGADTVTLAVIAEREGGEGFSDRRIFRFRIFKWLRARDAGDQEAQDFVGVAFRHVSEVTSKKAYCGANEAFLGEFGVSNPENRDGRR
jgi:hypothetical protein